MGGAYADEGRLLSEWLRVHGSGVVGGGALLVGDKLYGYRGRLLLQAEEVGWLPVVRVGGGLRQGVRHKAGVRALERLGGVWMGVGGALSGGAGVWEGEGGVWELREWSSLGVCARSGGEMLVLWNLVQWLRVGGGSDDFYCVVLAMWVG